MPGRELVAAVEALEDELVAAAARAEDDGSYAAASVGLLKDAGVTSAFVPVDFGGGGVDRVADLAVAMNRLGRADGSAALLTTMHSFRVLYLTKTYELLAGSDAGDSVAEQLRGIAAGQMVAAMVTEAGVDHRHLEATAARDGANRWVLNGTKIFATGSPSADWFGVVYRFRNETDEWRFGTTLVPAESAGVEQNDDWNAMGMRASGSQSVTFRDCVLPEPPLDLGPWGAFNSSFLMSNAVAFAGLTAAFVGIAEAAYAQAHATILRRGNDTDASYQFAVGEIETKLAASRAMIERSAQDLDAVLDRHDVRVPIETAHRAMAGLQSTKLFATQTAIEIVDRSMGLAGGGAYTAPHPMSRLYRDVRAGPFMQPFSPTYAPRYIGQVVLGLQP